MLITKASEYALLSLVMLSKSTKPLDTDTLSTKLNIPKSFLAKILQSLAKHKLLKSYKGANGGFALDKKPADISVMEIFTAAEKKAPSVFECASDIECCPTEKRSACFIWPIFNTLQGKVDSFLTGLTLEDIMEQ